MPERAPRSFECAATHPRRRELNDTTKTHSAEPIKPKLLDLLRRGQAELQAWIDDLTDDERAAIGAADSWAPKDTLAHMTFWAGVGAARLVEVKRSEQPAFEPPYTLNDAWLGVADSENFQPFNDATFERMRLRPWDDALADSRRAFDALSAGAEALSEAQLTDTTFFPWHQGRPLWSSVLGNGFEHPLEHLAHYYRQRGDLAHAEEIVARQGAGMLALDNSDQAQGGVRYNQGCFWALAGQPDRAIPLLREALTLRPDLLDWSRQDTDLVTLRDLPAFQAIYTDLGA